MMNELKLLYKRQAFWPIHLIHLSELQKTQVLELLMFLKEKRDDTIKGCGCAERLKQREHIDPTYATSPTVSTEIIMLTPVIDAYEGRGKGCRSDQYAPCLSQCVHG